MKIKLLSPNAKVPTVEHPGSDLGYDLYCLNNILLLKGFVAGIRTGIAIEFPKRYGGIIKDRSSMAFKGITVSGGVIDSGYRGEIIVLLTYNGPHDDFLIKTGDKIAQIVLQRTNTREPIEVVNELSGSDRGEKGFGSSGR
jgi:dUTP pyrophosphatase